MSRALEMFVFGVIAFAQLALVLFLLERHAHSATLAAPVHAIWTAPIGTHLQQMPAASAAPSAIPPILARSCGGEMGFGRYSKSAC